MAGISEKEALIERLETSRVKMGLQVKSLQQALDVPGRIKEQAKKHPIAIFGGSMAGGWVISKYLRRPKIKHVPKKKGTWALILPFLLSLFKPVLQNLIMREVHRRVSAAHKGTVH